MRGGLVWLCAAVAALGACAGRSVSHSKDDDVGASGSATGGASGSATGGASGSATSGASGSVTGGTAGIPDMRRCEQAGDCALVPRTTCCLCGVPELENVTAVNAEEAAEYSRRLCAMSPPCQCMSGPNPDLVATCEAGTCVAIDVRAHPVSACRDHADCRVRVTDCCECGSSTSVDNLIAVRPTTDYDELVCPPMTACPECAPSYPPEIGAFCRDGHCLLIVLP